MAARPTRRANAARARGSSGAASPELRALRRCARGDTTARRLRPCARPAARSRTDVAVLLLSCTSPPILPNYSRDAKTPRMRGVDARARSPQNATDDLLFLASIG